MNELKVILDIRGKLNFLSQSCRNHFLNIYLSYQSGLFPENDSVCPLERVKNKSANTSQREELLFFPLSLRIAAVINYRGRSSEERN